MEQMYYWMDGGELKGPLPRHEIEKLLRDGMRVSVDGACRWISCDEFLAGVDPKLPAKKASFLTRLFGAKK